MPSLLQASSFDSGTKVRGGKGLKRPSPLFTGSDDEGAIELTDNPSTKNGSDDGEGFPLMDDELDDDDHLSDHESSSSSNKKSTEGSASKAQVAVNIIISFVGAGLLGVPATFQRAGWLLGSVTLCTVSALNVYAMLLLPKVRAQIERNQQVQSRRNADNDKDGLQPRCDSYGALGNIIMGPRGETLVNVCLVVSQVGFATAYIIFIAANLDSIASVPRWITCTACIPGLMLLVQAQEMKTLSPFSLLADLANLLGLSAVLLEDWDSYIPHNDAIRAVKWEGMLFVIAITIYSMEGVGLILSLESSCREKSSFPSLFKLVLTGITLFMAFFGTAGYFAFGDDTQAPITLNLSRDSNAASFVKGALCLALYLTYPVMMFPVWAVADKAGWTPRPWNRVVLRCTLVVLTSLIAYSIPDFGKFLALVGSSFCTLLGFILPCYFHWQVMPNLRAWERYIDVALMTGGALFAVVGTYQSFVDLLNGEGGE